MERMPYLLTGHCPNDIAAYRRWRCRRCLVALIPQALSELLRRNLVSMQATDRFPFGRESVSSARTDRLHAAVVVNALQQANIPGADNESHCGSRQSSK